MLHIHQIQHKRNDKVPEINTAKFTCKVNLKSHFRPQDITEMLAIKSYKGLPKFTDENMKRKLFDVGYDVRNTGK